MALKQETRLLNLFVSGLPENELLLTAFGGEEEMSRLFRYQLQLISDNNDIHPGDVIGQNVTFAIRMGDDGVARYFNGYISQFCAGDEEHGRRNYRAEVVPWLWFLTCTANCRIFQNKTARDIVEQIFSERGFSNFEVQLRREHKLREYCVQYRESDFAFISRLLENEGAFYFFRHENGKHTMVLGDHPRAYQESVESEIDFPGSTGSHPLRDHITSWNHRYEFRTGRTAQMDFNFKTPSADMMAGTKSLVKLPNIDKYEVYDYPGRYLDKGVGAEENKLRMEEIEAGQDEVHATSTCKSLMPGFKFRVGEHRATSEQGKAYVVTRVESEATEPRGYESGGNGSPSYLNIFRCMPDSVPARPARVTTKPIVNGVQTAIVVGPPGEEIYPDEFGRVKVQFHWDREGQRNESSSCWIRVSQAHAGKGFGAIDLPRIGDEVIVSFLEGDPDQPIITGRVYHADNMPPFGLPGSKTISGMKTKTYKGSGYNEYVMDDTPGKELIREHGQHDKDSTIGNDLREHVLNNRSRDVAVDEKIDIGSNQTVTVGADQKLTIGANQTTSIGADQKNTIGANQSTGVGADQSVSVGASHKMIVGASRTINVASNDSLDVGGTVTMNAGGAIEITSGASITLIAGGSSIEIGPGGITLSSTGTITEKAALVKHNA